jgi:Tfp pilus assembly protein PilV
MKTFMQSQRGAGLVETLLVVLFIAISITALAKFQHFLTANTHYTQQQNSALILAAKQIETLRDFAVLQTTAGYNAYQNIASGNSTTTLNETSYTITWTITSNTNPTYKIIDVTVAWTDRSNTSRSVQLTSRVAGLDPATSALVI